MPTNSDYDGFFNGIGGVPIFTYGMISVTTLVLAYMNYMDQGILTEENASSDETSLVEGSSSENPLGPGENPLGMETPATSSMATEAFSGDVPNEQMSDGISGSPGANMEGSAELGMSQGLSPEEMASGDMYSQGYSQGEDQEQYSQPEGFSENDYSENNNPNSMGSEYMSSEQVYSGGKKKKTKKRGTKKARRFTPKGVLSPKGHIE